MFRAIFFLSAKNQVLGRQRNQQRVHTMTVEDGHVVDVDGGGAASGNNKAAAAGADKGTKYAQSSADHATVTSGVGRNSLFAPQADDDNANQTDRLSARSRAGSMFAGDDETEAERAERARKELPWYRGVTWKDIKDIMPTVIILLVGLLIMIFVIPYAFSSVIKQLEAESRAEEAKERARMATAATNATAAPTDLTTAAPTT